MNIIKSIPPKFQNNCFVSLDTEFMQMNSKQLHRPSGKFGCLTICNGEDVYYIDEQIAIPNALNNISNCTWAIQDGKFDLTHLRRFTTIEPRKKYWDTLYIDRILWSGYYDNFSLSDLSRRYLNHYLDKSLQKSFEKSIEMSDQQIEYACMDAYITYRVAQEQRKIMTQSDFNIWADIDRPAVWAIMDFQGFAIDPDKWTALAELNRSRQEEIDAQLPLNPRSHVQVKKWFAEHGLKLDSSDEETLTKVVHKQDGAISSVAKRILESRTYGKRASTYGTKFLEDYLEHGDGYDFVVPDFDPNIAISGRMSSSDPNIQNQINEPEYRECYIARPGNKLIIADYSAQEPRITAFLTKDKTLLKIFKENKDVYIELARDVFGENITKKDPRRKTMKSVFLGCAYGLSKYGLAAREDISVETANMLLNKTFTLLGGVRTWMDEQQHAKKYVTTIAGRKCWINPYCEQSTRISLNAPHQGSGADMLKKSFATMHQEWKFDCPYGVVAPVHDELILDVPEKLAPEIAKFVVDIMVGTAEDMTEHQLPFKVDYVIANNWSEKE
jgi:DNA polymerase-1